MSCLMILCYTNSATDRGPLSSPCAAVLANKVLQNCRDNRPGYTVGALL